MADAGRPSWWSRVGRCRVCWEGGHGGRHRLGSGKALHPRPPATFASSRRPQLRQSDDFRQGPKNCDRKKMKRSGSLQVTRNASYAGWTSAGQRRSTSTAQHVARGVPIETKMTGGCHKSFQEWGLKGISVIFPLSIPCRWTVLKCGTCSKVMRSILRHLIVVG